MASDKADDRGPAGTKRSRSDGDWSCPQCGNVNFSFRTVCNRSKCGAPRPSPSPRPLPGQFNPPPPYYLGGMGVPPPMPYGMSGGYRVPLPYSGMRYEYGPSASVPGVYGFPPRYGPSGPFGGIGYGHDPGMNGYDYGFRGSPVPIPGPWSGGDSPDNGVSRKRRGGPDGGAEGDWKCGLCGNINFAFRTNCNIKKCAAPRPPSVANGGAASGNKDFSNAPEGSWSCDKCGNLNYPFRTVCNRKGCGAERPGDADQ